MTSSFKKGLSIGVSMQVSTLPLYQSKIELSDHKQSLKNEILENKTDQIAQVFISTELNFQPQKPVYEIRINGKNLIYPTYSDLASGKRIVFIGSTKITLEWNSLAKEDKLIEMTEEDETTKTVLYVDVSKVIEKIAYHAYTYLPRKMKLEEAVKKIQHIAVDSPYLNGKIKFYNRHGVGVFGWDKKVNQFALYWASPAEEKKDEKSKRFEYLFCIHVQDCKESKFIATSQFGSVNFTYLVEKGLYLLNQEPVTRI